MINLLNSKKETIVLTERKHDLLKVGKIKLTQHSSIESMPPPPDEQLPSPPSCFIAGSLVLMANMSWKPIESVKVGELMYSSNGPVECVEAQVTRLGNKKMITFEDQSLFWSEEHSFWTRNDDVEWFWCYNTDTWRQEVSSGHIGGLLNDNSLRNGELLLEYAHIDGWKLQKSKLAEDSFGFDENTSLYLPATHGALIVVNGYLVGACINERNFDYTKIKWDRTIVDYKHSLLVEEY